MVPHTQMMVCQHREQRKKINKEKKRKPKYIHPLSKLHRQSKKEAMIMLDSHSSTLLRGISNTFQM